MCVLSMGAVRNHFLAGIVLVLVVAVCSSPRATSSAAQVISCANASEPFRSHVVVEHLSGASLEPASASTAPAPPPIAEVFRGAGA